MFLQCADIDSFRHCSDYNLFVGRAGGDTREKTCSTWHCRQNPETLKKPILVDVSDLLYFFLLRGGAGEGGVGFLLKIPWGWGVSQENEAPGGYLRGILGGGGGYTGGGVIFFFRGRNAAAATCGRGRCELAGQPAKSLVTTIFLQLAKRKALRFLQWNGCEPACSHRHHCDFAMLRPGPESTL